MVEDRQWYNYEVNQVSEKLDTNTKEGLSSQEVDSRIEEYGTNELPEKETTPEWKKFLAQFNDILIYVLLFAGLVTFLLGSYVDTIFIVAVAIVNAIIGYSQESKAEQALENIKGLLSSEATVVRNGASKKIDTKNLVPGDIVTLSAGDKAPADIRLFQANNLNVEESSLTGESTSVEKSTEPLEGEVALGDRTNMLFSSTSIASGSGKGVVVKTAEHTEIGKINQSISEVEETKTPLIEQTDNLGKVISLVVVGIAILTFLAGYFAGDWAAGELLIYVIGLTVGAIPEGLPAILSIILSVGVQAMANQNAIVKNLPSVETLGAVSVIASDKTGTLTKNEMTVKSIVLEDEEYDVTGTGYAPEGKIQNKDGEEVLPSQKDELWKFLSTVKTVNETELYQDEENNWQITGEPTEGSLVTLAEKASEPIRTTESIDTIPFDSSYKYMAKLISYGEEHLILVKGAPDRLFDLAFNEDDQEIREYWENKMTEHASQGERLIGAAIKTVNHEKNSLSHEDLEEGLRFVGLAGIIDPPREEAIEAIADAKRAGIQIKMITGDHKQTAMAIGEQMGIGDGTKALEGKDIDNMSDEELRDAVLEYDIYARTSPENKLQLVHAMQANDLVMAMTGDGVNDAPALKRSDVGVAMGIKGTEVAKDASEMVLVDDNFATIYEAVKEGRRVYDNLKKTILFILPTNGAEAFLTFAAILLGWQMPLTPIQILYINMISSITVSLPLAFERLESGTMRKPPRSKNTKLLSNYYLFRIAFVSLLIGGSVLLMNHLFTTNGYDPAITNTVTLHSIVLAQMFHLFNVRNEQEFVFGEGFFANKSAFYISAALIAVQIAITYIPFTQSLLGIVPIPAVVWIIPVIIGFFVFVVVEIEKWVTRTFFSNQDLNKVQEQALDN